MRDPGQPISDAERDVLKVLWDRGQCAVRDIRDSLRHVGREWAHTTVNTLLTRLETKGLVECDRSGFAHQFKAASSRDDVVRDKLKTLSEDFCDGTKMPLMLALVDGQKFSSQEIDEFRHLLDSLEAQSARKKKSAGKSKPRSVRKGG